MAIPKRVMNFAYGMGAAVVILGALFKITHKEFGPLNGNNMLTLGLVVEALIFAISAFEPVDEEYDWSKVYPELKGGEPKAINVNTGLGTPTVINTGNSNGNFSGSGSNVTPASAAFAQQSGGASFGYAEPPMEKTLLSEKLDQILRDAKIDGNLMESLRKSIENFESAARGIAPTVDVVASSNKYSEEMMKAASQLGELNVMYKSQLDSATQNANINREVAENNLKLKEQMMSLTSNLSTLNAVYGGMLTAMGKTSV